MVCPPLRVGEPHDRPLNAFPPEDISGFLELSAGEWLALRSLLGPESLDTPKALSNPTEVEPLGSERWHQSDRGELRMTVLEPQSADDHGGLEVTLPAGTRCRLIFRADGTLLLDGQDGRWHLASDGSLELVLEQEAWIVKERIWFSKPNLRLRCTLEQSLDGRPGRASFSSEIRRVQPSQNAVSAGQT